MSYENESCAMLLLQIEEKIHDHLAGFSIKVARWLVSEQNRWFDDKGPGQSDALLFAAGKFSREMVETFCESGFF